MKPAAPIRFVIFAAPRTGSNLLCSLLNSHPEILCHHGLFNPDGIHYALDHRERGPYLGTTAQRDDDPKDFLERVWRHHDGHRAVGFKLNLGENPAAVSCVLRDREIRKILLTRRSRIKTYVSERIAEQSGEWESYAGTSLSPARAVRVDAEELFRHIERNRRYYAHLEDELRADDQTWLEVNYEALDIGGTGGDLNRALAFLGLRDGSGRRLTPGSVKRNPDDLQVLITNLAELRSALAGTDLECELDANAPQPAHCGAGEEGR